MNGVVTREDYGAANFSGRAKQFSIKLDGSKNLAKFEHF